MSAGEVVGRGRFRVDRKLALEKMERFQLEDPYRYVLEWLSAGICSGATSIAITNDSDDFVIEWEGELPSRDELEALLDHVFGHPTTARGAMLQHLAVGVLGALGIGPRWLHVDRGGVGDDPAVRLDVVNPAETPTKPLPSGAPIGLRCHVRERLGQHTMAEALMLPFRDPVEARLVAGAAVWCPVPVRINGRLLPRRGAPEVAIASMDVDLDGRTGQLWVLPPRVEGQVDLLRHGVVVGHAPLGFPDPPTLSKTPFQVAGWFRDDRLKLNASRSAIVEDAAWVACRKGLDEALVQLLQTALTTADAAADHELSWTGPAGIWRASRAELVEAAGRAALLLLGPHRKDLGDLADQPLLEDVTGNRWTPRQLRAAKPVPAVTELADPEAVPGDRAVFSGDMATVLRAVVPGAPDVTEAMRLAAEGRDRRQKALALRSEPWFEGEVVQRRFVRGDLRGAVRLSYPGAGGRGELRVVVRVGGLPIELLTRDGPAAALEGIVDDPGFSPDTGFRQVARDERFGQALDVLYAEAEAFVVDRIRALRTTDTALVLLTSLLHGRWKEQAGELDELVDLADLEIFPSGSGLRRSLRTLFTATEPWLVVQALPPVCPDDIGRRVLLLPDEIARRWLGWLGARGRDGSGLADELERARRLAAPREAAILQLRRGAAHAVKVPVAVEGITGELATSASAESVSSLQILRRGVAVCEIVFPLDLVGVLGVVDVADLEVNASHSWFASPDAVPGLAKRLEPAVEALVLALWDRLVEEGRPVPNRVIDWLARADRSRSAAVRQRPLVPSGSGERLSLSDLIARAPSKRGPKIVMLSEPPPPSLAFHEAIVVTPALRKLVEQVLGPRVRDGNGELEKAKEALKRYTERPLAPPQARALASVDVSDGDWSGTFFLPADPALIGLVAVQVLWRDRILATGTGGVRDLGLSARVRGEALLPDRTFTSIRDNTLLIALRDRSADLFSDLVGQALAAAERDGVERRDRSAWLALWTRLRVRVGTSLRREHALRIQQLPLVQRVDGAWSSLDEIRAAAASGTVVQRVNAGVPVGPYDHPWYLCEGPGVVDALGEILDRVVPDGTDTLLQWRVGQARRERLVRRSAGVIGPTLRRAELDENGLRGEVAILSPASAADGLRIEPLVDSLPLEAVTLPFTAPVAAVIEGVGVKADLAFEEVVRTADWERAVEIVRRHLHKLVDATLGSAVDGDLGAMRWATRFLVRGGGTQLQRATALFPLVDGTRTSILEIEQREVVGFVRSPWRAFVAGEQPVVADPALLELLEAQFRTVDLNDVGRRHATPSRPPRARIDGAVLLAPPRKGEVGLAREDDGVEVRVCGVAVTRLRTAGLPLAGWADDPALVPRHDWTGFVPNEALTAFEQAMAEAAGKVAAELARQAAKPAALERFGPALLHWLVRATPDAKTLRDAVAGAAGPEVCAVAALPLFVDSTSRRKPLVSVVASNPVRAVSPRAGGRPAPGESPFWRLDDATRHWLSRAYAVVDGEAELRLEEEGHTRRGRGRHPKRPTTRMGALTTALPNESRLCLVDPSDRGEVDLLVDGVQIGTLDLGVPGLVGWIDGPFATDPGFTEATVDARTRKAVDEAVLRLLTRERMADPAATVTRFAHRGPGPVADVWDDVAVFKDRLGAAVSFARLVNEVERHASLVFTPLPPGPVVNRRVLALTPPEERWIAYLFPKVPLLRSEQLVPAPSPKTRKEPSPRAGRERVHEAVRELAAWSGRERQPLDTLLRRWETSPPPVLVQATADPRGAAVALAAWVAGTEAYGRLDDTTAAEEVAFVGRIADELAERVRRR